MRFGLTVPNFGDCFDPRVLAGLARDAEQAGWDGFFVWDHAVIWPTPIVDPWVAFGNRDRHGTDPHRAAGHTVAAAQAHQARP